MLLSECCTAPPAGEMEEYGICSKCKEHCEFQDDEENENEYKLYGKKWETEIMKLPKQQIVNLYRISCIRANTKKRKEEQI